MKAIFLVHNEVYAPRIMEILKTLAIDYYTIWEHVKGKGHGTEAHLGTRSFPNMNEVLMIGIQEDTTLERLTDEIVQFNAKISRPDDQIRLFQIPLEKLI